ncbi:protein of unknown function [Nitrosotalea devaniterrae]|uniref:Uncharacterized protein n=1 Tax=Nitrosotalea devaniterrae TaxID=1078905 RepID=A0A128A592_9ARCH|nr:protein of unknown function [Candidatus Nitrosotalea devanaterra]
MSRVNLSKCPNCKLGLISEEKDTHECLKVEDYWVIDGVIWLGDGMKYYPLKHRSVQSDDFFRSDRPDEDSPEPLKDGFKYYVSFLVIR